MKNRTCSTANLLIFLLTPGEQSASKITQTRVFEIIIWSHQVFLKQFGPVICLSLPLGLFLIVAAALLIASLVLAYREENESEESWFVFKSKVGHLKQQRKPCVQEPYYFFHINTRWTRDEQCAFYAYFTHLVWRKRNDK